MVELKLVPWCADRCNENKNFHCLANQRTLLASRNEEKNMKNNSKNK